MNDLYKKSAAIAISVFSLILTVVPEDMFKCIKFLKNFSDGLNIIFNRTILFLIIFLLTMFLYKVVENDKRKKLYNCGEISRYLQNKKL